MFWHTQYLDEHVQTLLSTGTVGEHFPYFKTIHHKVSLDVNIVICKVDRISRYYLDMHYLGNRYFTPPLSPFTGGSNISRLLDFGHIFIPVTMQRDTF